MKTIFLVVWFASGTFTMTPMPDEATCKAMNLEARFMSGGPVTVTGVRCLTVENGEVIRPQK